MDPEIDVYVRLRTELLVLGESIVIDLPGRADAADFTTEDQLGGVVLPFPLWRWLGRGIARVAQRHGATVCRLDGWRVAGRTGDPPIFESEEGYHEPGACARGRNVEEVCVVVDLLRGFGDRPAALVRRPLRFAPVRADVDVTRGQAAGRYRRLAPGEAGSLEGGEPPGGGGVHAVASLEGYWWLTLRDPDPASVGLLALAVDYLDDHRTDPANQVGRARDLGAGVLECELLNPLYGARELERVFERGADSTPAMDEKDRRWRETCRPACVDALAERLAAWP
jgi:hypothetical protein